MSLFSTRYLVCYGMINRRGIVSTLIDFSVGKMQTVRSLKGKFIFDSFNVMGTMKSKTHQNKREYLGPKVMTSKERAELRRAQL